MATATHLTLSSTAQPTPHDAAVPRWATPAAVALGLFFTGAGVMRLLPVPFDMALFADWGLPAWFRTATGLGELTVGLLTLRRSSRPIGLVGIGTVMVSAGTMHAALGHSLLVSAAVNGTLAASAFATAYALRSTLR